ncbi:MAG: response regulator, partial [Myxococcota bacterium]
GLAICRQLVELMDGTLSVESEPDKGTSFSFTALFAKPTAAHLAAQPLPDEPDAIRVLIVDDNATNRQILRHHVRSWGMRESVASHPEEALEMARARAAAGVPYSLAIVDMHPPEMNGLALARELRAGPLTRDIKIVMCTTGVWQPGSDEAVGLDIQRFINKPIKYSQLRDIVLGACRSDDSAEKPPHQTPPAAAMDRDRLRDCRILVVEDNVINQKFALRLLRNRGLRADAVANGLEALEAIDRVCYDAILMDCQMPEMDGYEATAEIRRREKPGQRVPIIAMTAHAMPGDRDKCINAGMDDYVSKPVEIAALEDILDRYLVTTAEVDGDEADEADAGDSAEFAARDDGHPPIDLDRLRAMFRGDSLRDLMDLYFEHTAGYLDKLRIAIASRSVVEIREIAHTCKGSSANYGIADMVETMVELERLSQDSAIDRADALCRNAEAQLSRLKQYCEQYL